MLLQGLMVRGPLLRKVELRQGTERELGTQITLSKPTRAGRTEHLTESYAIAYIVFGYDC